MVGVYNLYMYLCTLRLGERHKSCGHCRRAEEIGGKDRRGDGRTENERESQEKKRGEVKRQKRTFKTSQI